MSGEPQYRRVFHLPGRWRKVARDVDEEFAFHLSMRVEDLVAEGWDRADAEREARRQFGDVQRLGRACRRIGMQREGTMRIWDLMDALRQDLGFAGRQFVKQPLATGMAVLTLALGIGATTVVYSVVDAVVIDAVPFPEPDRLMVIREVTPQGDPFSTSDPNFLDWRARQRAFTDIGAYTFGDRTLSGHGAPERVSGLRVTHTALPVLGLEVIEGRGFLPDEDVPGGETRVALLAEGYWERRFGGDPGLVGATIRLDGEPFTVVGVLASNRAFPGTDVFTPYAPDPASDRSNHLLQAVGRLAPGVSVGAAREDMRRVAAELAEEYPEANAGWSATVESVRDWRVGDRLTRIGVFLLLAVTLLLLMACGSVSNILIARATARRREMGLRAALGAGRRRIVAQLATESAALGLAGAGLGVLLAWFGTPLVRSLGPADFPRLDQAALDGGVLAVALTAAVVSVMVFGLGPAVFVTRGGLFDALREGASSGESRSRRLRDMLVVGQFALAVVVVLGAGLMVRSFDRILGVELGFEPERALSFGVSLPDGAFTVEERMSFLDRLEEQLRALPGVEAVGFTMSRPFGPFQASNFVAPAEDVPDRQDDFVPVSWRGVSTGFFDAAGIALLSGRRFRPQDGPPEEGDLEGFEIPVIVDENLARRLWGSPDAAGAAVVWSDPSGPTMRVVGVVRTVRDERVDGPPRPRIYLPYSLIPWPEPVLLVRSSSDPTSLTPAVRDIVRGMDGDVPVIGAASLAEAVRNAVAWPRFTMQVLLGFGLFAVLLAGLGLYGIAAFSVARRRREIGIRVALGAQPGSVVRLVVRAAIRLAVAGTALGVVMALSVSGFLESLLYDTAPTDAVTFVTVPLLLTGVALVASWLPARKATGIRPADALAEE